MQVDLLHLYKFLAAYTFLDGWRVCQECYNADRRPHMATAQKKQTCSVFTFTSEWLQHAIRSENRPIAICIRDNFIHHI